MLPIMRERSGNCLDSLREPPNAYNNGQQATRSNGTLKRLLVYARK